MSEKRQLDPIVLREYDIRGVIGEMLTADDYRAIGQAFGTMAIRQDGRKVAIGYDGRLTSPELADALVAGVAASGIDVKRIGCGPTPMLYFAVHHLDADGGMMVTGSHNPPEYNGIKMTLGGKPFFGDQVLQLGEMTANGDYAHGAGSIEDVPIVDIYVKRLVADYCGDRELAVAWDPGNGAVGVIIRPFLDRLPGRHVVINAEVDGRFPAHHPDPTVEENLVQLRDAVLSHGCDLGVAFDGDGDRIGVLDSLGRVVWGDQLLLMLARPILAELPGASIIADVKSSQILFDEIERAGGKAVMSRTGHSLIKSLMAEIKSPLAGEMSGHVFFRHRYYGFDDAPYAAVRLMSVLAQSTKSLADMLDELPPMINTPELRIDCSEDRKFSVVEEVRDRLKSVNGISVKDIDGVRVSTADGWWLLRASNTQAVLVGRCEAHDQAGLQKLLAELDRQLRLSGIENRVREAI